MMGEARAADSVPTYDAARYLVNKDVGEQRWAITQNLADGTVTGNVFLPGGGAPEFIWCEDVSDGEGEEKTFSCWGAVACETAPCGSEAWTYLADVPLSSSFFTPTGEVEWVSTGQPVTLPRSFFEPPDRAGSESVGAGVQVTRDGARALVSKDVGAERWAITRNSDDGTVTGNVFFSGGGEPAFLWCEETGSTESDVTLACRFAEVVVFGPIEDAEGNYFVNSLTGSDDDDGTRIRPFRTIEGALESLPETGGRIFVAGGAYTPGGATGGQRLFIDDRSRIELYGSFDPSTWIRDRASFPSRIETGPKGVLIHDSVAVLIDGFTIETDDATVVGESSIGVFVDASRIITLTNNTIRVGDGAAGLDGEAGAGGIRGGSGADGEDAAICVVPARRDGGRGGSGTGGYNGGRGGNGTGADRGDAGESGDGPNGGEPLALPGKMGAQGQDGFGGIGLVDVSCRQNRLRRLACDGRSSPGSEGAAGGAGGGGSGGRGGGGVPPTAIPPAPGVCGGGGGGGGEGGTGGQPGAPATSGGSSIGIAVGADSDVEVLANSIQTGDGGPGGLGGLGGPGGRGGAYGDGGAPSTLGGEAGEGGGAGGSGGVGGHGGSGGGGWSAGIVVGTDASSLVIREGNTFELGEPGRGPLRERGPGETEADPRTKGADGQRVEYYELSRDAVIPF